MNYDFSKIVLLEFLEPTVIHSAVSFVERNPVIEQRAPVYMDVRQDILGIIATKVSIVTAGY